MISRDDQAPPFVTSGDQLEQHRGFRLILSHVAEVLENEHVVFVELLDGALQRQSLTSQLQALHEIRRSGEQDPVAVLDQRVAEGGAEMLFSRPGRTRGILPNITTPMGGSFIGITLATVRASRS